ncbi:MAG: acyl-ACP thioesterase domain-containing protein [Bacteroidota bacterium]
MPEQYEKEDLRHRQGFHLRTYEMDQFGYLSPTGLIRLLQEAAMQHVLRLKISAVELGKRGLGWALIQQQTDIFRWPDLREEVEILTYPCGYNRAFTYRDFLCYDASGELIAQSRTTWLLMDIVARKMAAYPEDILALLEASKANEHLPRADRRFPMAEGEVMFPDFVPGWYDLDFNGHVSNAVLVKAMLEGLPKDLLATHQLRQLNIKFQEEAHLGEALSRSVAALEAGKWALHLKRGDTSLVRAYSEWDPKA